MIWIIGPVVLIVMVWGFAWILGAGSPAAEMQSEIINGGQYIQANPLDGVLFIVYLIAGFILLVVCVLILRLCYAPPEHRDEIIKDWMKK
jgi:hypothetical protein